MDGLLTISSSSRKGTPTAKSEDVLLRSPQTETPSFISISSTTKKREQEVHSPQTCIEILKSKPTLEEVIQVLRFIDPANLECGRWGFNIAVPNAANAQIIHQLVCNIIPDYWGILRKNSSDGNDKLDKFNPRAAFLRSLSSVTGITALTTRLRVLLTPPPTGQELFDKEGLKHAIRDTLSVLSAVLKPRTLLHRIQVGLKNLVDCKETQKHTLWKEFVACVAGGKTLSTAAEALRFLSQPKGHKSLAWLADGEKYSVWLGQNIAYFIRTAGEYMQSPFTPISDFWTKSMNLGYKEALVEQIIEDNLLQSPRANRALRDSMLTLKNHDRLSFVIGVLHYLQSKYFPDSPTSQELYSHDGSKVIEAIGGGGAVISCFSHAFSDFSQWPREWLAKGKEITSLAMRRVVVASLRLVEVVPILEEALTTFGDPLTTKHTPIRTQEAIAEAILLLSARLRQAKSIELQRIIRSRPFLTAVSNRLTASLPRSRLLGMLVGMALSRLASSSDDVLNFDLDESEQKELQYFVGLTQLNYAELGNFESLKVAIALLNSSVPSLAPQAQAADTMKENIKPTLRSKIEVLTIEDEEEDKDLLPYEKPDSDPEDSEDDVTLIDRSKPNPPVYIRHLLEYLRDSENVSKYHLGITTAAALIRKKAAFGTEVAEYMDALALAIVSLQDKYQLERFYEYRLQALVALLVSFPTTMGKWFTNMLFKGDLSQDQRAAILIALGLGARSLAGFNEEDAEAMNLPKLADTSFPSKRLPEKMEAIYADGDSTMATLTQKITDTTLKPLALQAADAASGPNALKVRTFSSRIEVDKKRRQKEEERRKRATSQDIHKVLSDGIFFPLITHFNLIYHNLSKNSYNPFMTPNLLRLVFQTLTVTLSTLGPYTPRLAALTHEAIALLVTLHSTSAVMEPLVLPAILSFLLTIIELSTISGSTSEERLVVEYGSEIVVLREWVSFVYDRTPTEQNDTKMLAAGIMVKLGEVVQRFQGRLFGVNSSFEF